MFNRWQDELRDLTETRNNRAIELKLHIDAELEKLRTGYACPDLRQKKVVTKLREWDRSVSAVPGFIMYPFKTKAGEAMDIDQ